jgi:hypothetical protein
VESLGLSILSAGNHTIPITLAAVVGSILGGKIQSKYPSSSTNALYLSFAGQLAAVLALFKMQGINEVVLCLQMRELWDLPLRGLAVPSPQLSA